LPAFLLALLAAVAATLAGPEAVRLTRLSAALGSGTALLVAGWIASIIASSLVARLGAALAAELAPEARMLLMAIALALASIELLVLRPGRAPAEPTRSLGAVLLVLGAAQVTAASGLLTFALAAATGAPGPVAAGGALGSGAVLTAAWWAGPQWESRMPSRLLRPGVAALLLVAALATGLSVCGLL